MPAFTFVLDGSAVFALLLKEENGPACAAALAKAETVWLSAGSLHEMLVVAAGKGLTEEVDAFLAAVQPDVLPLTAERARAAASAYRRWGKGFNPAGLNLADSFAFATAEELALPLLYVGNDFALTDIRSALP